ncbi:MAG: hypothetical protein ABWW70_07265 [Thermoproteota archaeon]
MNSHRENAVDLLRAYMAGLLNLGFLWFIWEDKCKATAKAAHVCREVRELTRTNPAQGPVYYFSSQIKTILMRFYLDFTPGLFLPRWLMTFSYRQKQDIRKFLSKLAIEEQASRLPYYMSFMLGVDAAFRAAVNHYNLKGSEQSYITSSYVYWEIIRPLSIPSIAYVKRVSEHRSEDLERIYAEVLETVAEHLKGNDSQPVPPRLVTPYLEKATAIIREDVLSALKRLRARLGEGT